MRVALVIHEYPPVGGGAATAAAQTARALTADGHQVLVVTGGGARQDDGPVRVEGLPSLRLRTLAPSELELLSFCGSAAVLLERRLREFGAEGVIAYFAVPAGPFAVRAARRLGIPVVVSLRGSDVPGFRHGRLEGKLGRLARPVIRWTLRRADAIAPNSDVLRELALAFMPELAGRLEVVPNGIEEAAIAAAPAGSGAAGLRVIQVGQLIPRKRVDVAIEAVGRVPGATLTVIGDGPLAAALAAKAGDRVTFVGHQPRAAILETLRRHDLFVMTSVAEGMSNALVEAMAAGLPIVTSANGSHDVVERAGCGLVVPPGDAAALAAAIAELAADPARREAMARAGLAAAHGLTWTACARRLIALLGSLSRPDFAVNSTD